MYLVLFIPIVVLFLSYQFIFYDSETQDRLKAVLLELFKVALCAGFNALVYAGIAWIICSGHNNAGSPVCKPEEMSQATNVFALLGAGVIIIMYVLARIIKLFKSF